MWMPRRLFAPNSPGRMPRMVRKTYAARRSQLISTFGVGSLFPAENNSFMITSIDQWDRKYLKPVSEPRLARSLRVSELFLPPSGRGGVPVVRFPQMLVCSSCQRIGTTTGLRAAYDDPRCGLCKSPTPLTPSRFVTACEDGHIDDFPYSFWVHGSARGGDAAEHELSLSSEGRTSSLADMVVRCSCGEQRSMVDAFNPVALRELKCQGHRPWLGRDYQEKGCGKAPRTVQRGASNVWFPMIRSAISIPPYSEFLAKVVTFHASQLGKPQALEPASTWVLEGILEDLKGRFSLEQLRAEIRRQFHGGDTTDLSEDQLREQEFMALLQGRRDSPDTDFVAEKVAVPTAHTHWVKAARKVTRLREVRALHGFSRLNPGNQDTSDPKPSKLFPEDNAQHWLPAIETLGEGLFVALDRAQVEEWARTDFAAARRRMLDENARRAAEQRDQVPIPVDIVQTLVHTLSHIIIDQLSLDAGYPASSIRERLYVGRDQVGVLLYTASSDSAGSLGGIAAQAGPERLGASLDEGLLRTSWCSADPVCIESTGSGTDARNLAACHCCVLVPETSCELFNGNLDRATLFGVHGNSDLGFKEWALAHPLQSAPVPTESGTVVADDDVPDNMRGTGWVTLFVESGPRMRELVEELVEADIEATEWGHEVGPEGQWSIDLAWPAAQVAVLEDTDEARDEWLIEDGWMIYHITDWSPSELADTLAETVY
ncbi:DrmB family protein [Arthrobacter sp. MDT1-65]